LYKLWERIAQKKVIPQKKFLHIIFHQGRASKEKKKLSENTNIQKG